MNETSSASLNSRSVALLLPLDGELARGKAEDLIRDFNDLPNGTVLQADLCIIGAGAAGLLIARSFAHSGRQIVLLECGGWSAEAETERLLEGRSAPGPFRGLQAGRSRVFGGTTTLWGGQCIRLDPVDFEYRPWVPHSGWPIRQADLAPHYDAAEAALEMDPDDIRMPAWERFGLHPLAFDGSRLRSVHGVFIRRPDLGRRFRAELAASRSINVLLHATAQNIEIDAYGTHAVAADFANLGGKRGRVLARRIVLCGGAIENARLLLLSDKQRPKGLGNDYDHVGRYLQDHPCGQAATVETGAPRVLQDHFNMLYGKGTRYLPKIALSEQAQREEGLLNCVARLAYDVEASGTRALLDLAGEVRTRRRTRAIAGSIGRAAIGLPDILESAWRVRVKGLSPAPRPRRITLELFSEQTPDPDSRVTLDTATDAMGLRRVRVDWRLDELTGRTLRRFTRLVDQEFGRLGLGRLQEAPWLDDLVLSRAELLDSYHPAGTTRMALHPSKGVVDTDCQVFGVRGLYIAGSAVFPTSGAANPTLTIAAMALRLADRLKASFEEDAAVSLSPPAELSLARRA